MINNIYYDATSIGLYTNNISIKSMSVVIQTEKKIEEIRAKARQEVSYLRATALREGAKNASDKELFELANAYVNSVKSNQQSKSRKVNK